MTAKSLYKIMKLRCIKDQYWILIIGYAQKQNMNQILSHLENINKIDLQIKNLESNQIINFVYFN